MANLNQNHSTHEYRPDIDGLRALAVLSVVLYHAFPSKLKGGFIGVDIFFVISGYLISTIIFTNLDKGKFSFTEFYARRVKRIFPALLTVLFSSFVFGWYALLGDEFEQLGKHIFAGTAFVSNLVLWSESGYFDNIAETKPLLHLWSLGVEEQFYIIWPILVWLVWKRKLGLIVLIFLLIFSSFILNIYYLNKDSVAMFYSPLTRFWELSIGTLLAYLNLQKLISLYGFKKIHFNTISIFGLSLILIALITTNKGYTFPGWWAIMPVFGAALVISAGSDAWLNKKILSNKIVVWFGLISYPLYLWHWPLLAFGRLVEVQSPSKEYRILAVIVSVMLAWITYRFIERNIRFSKGYKFVFPLIVASIIVALLGAFVFINKGVETRAAILNSGFNKEVRRQFMGSLWVYTKNNNCMNEYPYRDENKFVWFCMKNDKKQPSIVILGNSYANQLYPGFIKNPLLNHHSVLSIGACDFAGIDSTTDVNSPCYGSRIKDHQEFIDNIILNTPSIKFVVLDGLTRDPSFDYIEKLRQHISFLERKGIRVIIFTPHLKPHFHPKSCFTTPLRKVAKNCTFNISERKLIFDKFYPVIESISKSNPKVRFFEQNEIFCNEVRCSYVLNGMPLYRDEGHTSEYASIELQKYFTKWAKKNIPEIFMSPGSQG